MVIEYMPNVPPLSYICTPRPYPPTWNPSRPPPASVSYHAPPAAPPAAYPARRASCGFLPGSCVLPCRCVRSSGGGTAFALRWGAGVRVGMAFVVVVVAVVVVVVVMMVGSRTGKRAGGREGALGTMPSDSNNANTQQSSAE